MPIIYWKQLTKNDDIFLDDVIFLHHKSNRFSLECCLAEHFCYIDHVVAIVTWSFIHVGGAHRNQTCLALELYGQYFLVLHVRSKISGSNAFSWHTFNLLIKSIPFPWNMSTFIHMHLDHSWLCCVLGKFCFCPWVT